MYCGAIHRQCTTVAMVTVFLSCYIYVHLCFHKVQSHMNRSISYHLFQPQTGIDVLSKMVQLQMKRG